MPQKLRKDPLLLLSILLVAGTLPSMDCRDAEVEAVDDT